MWLLAPERLSPPVAPLVSSLQLRETLSASDSSDEWTQPGFLLCGRSFFFLLFILKQLLQELLKGLSRIFEDCQLDVLLHSLLLKMRLFHRDVYTTQTVDKKVKAGFFFSTLLPFCKLGPVLCEGLNTKTICIQKYFCVPLKLLFDW